jgi:hypothetical protein
MKKQIVATTFLLMLIFSLTFAANPVSAQDEPLATEVYITPTAISQAVGTQFTLTVGISNVVDLAGFEVKLGWDPTVLTYVSHTKTPEAVLNPVVFVVSDIVDAAGGTYDLAAATLGGAPFSGSGVIFTVTLNVTAVGYSALAFPLHDLADPVPNPIAHTVVEGVFDNQPIVVEHDLTISVTGMGTTDPALGTYTYEEGTVVPVTAYPASGWMLDHWLLDTVDVGTANPYSVTMDADHTLEAVFAEIPPTQPRIFVSPPEIIDPTMIPGTSFSIDIQIGDVFDLYGYSFGLSYGTDVLTCTGVVITPPNTDPHFTTDIAVDDLLGEISVSVGYYTPAPPITLLSNSTVVTIFFMVQGYGCTPLDLHDTLLTNPVGDPIPHEVGDGFFCTLIADVAIVWVEPSTNYVYPGRPVNITVVAANLGDVTSTFDVTAYYANTTIGVQAVIDLPPDHNTTLIFVWDTTGLTPCNNFTISAYASPVPYELDFTNNYYESGGWVKIKIPGDVNSDGVVDIFDLVLASDAYGTQTGDPNYNPEADIAPRYGLVDIFDLVTIASHYGEGC